MNTIRDKACACLLSVALAAGICLAPYSRAFAVVPVAAAPLGYAIAAIAAACGFSLVCNNDSDAAAIAADFELYTDDIDSLARTAGNLMSAYSEAAAKSGQVGVPPTYDTVTQADVDNLANALSAAGEAGRLSLSVLACYLDDAGTALSSLPFILESYFLHFGVADPSELGFSSSEIEVNNIPVQTWSASSIVQPPSWAPSGIDSLDITLNIVSYGDAADLFGDVYDGDLFDMPYYGGYYIVPVCVDWNGTTVCLAIDKMYAPDGLDLSQLHIQGSLLDAYYSNWGHNLTAYYGSYGNVSPEVIVSDYGYVGFDVTFSPYPGTLDDFLVEDSAWNPSIGYYLGYQYDGFPNWDAVTDNPDVNLGRDWYADANQAVKGGLVLGGGVGALVGADAVFNGGYIKDRGSIAIPGSLGGVSSWGDALSRTNVGVGENVYAPDIATDATISAADAATGDIVTDTAGNLVRPGGGTSVSPVGQVALGTALQEFGGDLTRKFPFSIPWDAYRIVTAFDSGRKAPSGTVGMDVPGIGYQSLTVDLSQWDGAAAVLRTLFLVLFTVGLVVSSHKMITGGGE